MRGIIIKGIAGFYYVKVEDEIYETKARGVFRKRNITPMVGDHVKISRTGDEWTIIEVDERFSELKRPFVSNVSQAFVVFSLKNPDINFELLNKFIIMLEKSHIKPILIFNKKDIGEKETIDYIKNMFMGTDYKIKFISAKKQEDLNEITSFLKDNVTVLCGPSGAGKSTILNNILGRDHMETGELSKKHGRGKHTTRHSELIEVKGGLLVDTPGFSNMDIKLDPLELKDYFVEFNEYEGMCRFNGCVHDKEPGCKIKEEVGENISKERYDFYIKFLNKLREEYKRKW